MIDNPNDISRSNPDAPSGPQTRSRTLRRQGINSALDLKSRFESSSPLTTPPSSDDCPALKKSKTATNQSLPTASNPPSPTSKSRKTSLSIAPEEDPSKVPEHLTHDQVQDTIEHFEFESYTTSTPDRDPQPVQAQAPSPKCPALSTPEIAQELATLNPEIGYNSSQISSSEEIVQDYDNHNQSNHSDGNSTPKASFPQIPRETTPPRSSGIIPQGETFETILANIILYSKDLDDELAEFEYAFKNRKSANFNNEQLAKLSREYSSLSATFHRFSKVAEEASTAFDNIINDPTRMDEDEDYHNHYEDDNDSILSYDSRGLGDVPPRTTNPFAPYTGETGGRSEEERWGATFDLGSFQGQFAHFMNQVNEQLTTINQRLQKVENGPCGTASAPVAIPPFLPTGSNPPPFPPVMGVVARPVQGTTPLQGVTVGALGSFSIAHPPKSVVAQPAPKASPSKDAPVVVPGLSQTPLPKSDSWAAKAATKPATIPNFPKTSVKNNVANALKRDTDNKAPSNPANIRYIVKFEHCPLQLPPSEYLCHQMRESLSANNRTLGGGRIITTRWSEKGNLTIEFSPNTPRESIKNAAAALIAPLRAGSYTFEPQEPITKIVVTNVPTGFNVTGQIFSSEYLNDRLREVLPNYKNAKIFLQPSWISNPLTIHNEGRIRSAISFAIEDPGKTMSAKILERKVINIDGSLCSVKLFHRAVVPNLDALIAADITAQTSTTPLTAKDAKSQETIPPTTPATAYFALLASKKVIASTLRNALKPKNSGSPHQGDLYGL
ncbi:hypothetical protein FRC11_010293 [Ceratobasidium sp. 423]|nr:hypothetical protein FRC11_010293 [Ceratobasidium sp. 423]